MPDLAMMQAGLRRQALAKHNRKNIGHAFRHWQSGLSDDRSSIPVDGRRLDC